MAIGSLRDIQPSGALPVDSDDGAARRYGENTEDENSNNVGDMEEISSLSPDDFGPYFYLVVIFRYFLNVAFPFPF